MLKKSLFLIAVILFAKMCFAAKNDSIKYAHRWFAYWGYNREFFTNNNLTLKGNNYELHFYEIKAKDKPYPFTWQHYTDPQAITVAQYDYRVGYNLNEKLGISIGLDHMKYVADNSQFIRVSGYINADPKFVNHPTAQTFSYDQPVELTKNFLYLKHTNGLNLISADVDYRSPLFLHHFVKINLNSGVGIAAMVTKTQVEIYGYGQDNNFHLCGYAASTYQGLEFVFGKYFFIRPQIRLGWINLPAFLINGKSAPDRGSHNFAFVEGMLVAGSYFQVHSHQKKNLAVK